MTARAPCGGTFRPAIFRNARVFWRRDGRGKRTFGAQEGHSIAPDRGEWAAARPQREAVEKATGSCARRTPVAGDISGAVIGTTRTRSCRPRSRRDHLRSRITDRDASVKRGCVGGAKGRFPTGSAFNRGHGGATLVSSEFVSAKSTAGKDRPRRQLHLEVRQ